MLRQNQSFRNAIIIVVVILLASYVLMSFGSAPPVAQGDTIAKIGGAKIKMRDAWIQSENVKRTYGQFERSMVDQFVINGLMSNAVLRAGADDLGLGVSDEELKDYVIRFRTAGEDFISNEDWAYFIRNRYRVQVKSFEDYLRDHELKPEKFRSLFYNSAYVDESEIEKQYREQNQKVKLELVVLNTFEVQNELQLDTDEALKAVMEREPEAFLSGELRQMRFVGVPYADFEDQIEVTDEEAQAYFDENSERYMIREGVRAQHILIKAEERTEEEALALAQKVRKEIEEGLDFGEAAKQYSEDESNASRGGELGLFQRGRMVKPFEDAAFGMEVGAISEPIKTQFGYHLIKKNAHQQEEKRTLEAVKSSIVATVRRQKAKDQALDKIQEFRAKIDEGATFEEAAQAIGYETQLSSFFDNDRNSNLGPVLTTNFQARRAAFELANLQDISDPLTLPREAVLMQWTAEKEPQPLTLENDRVRIERTAKEIGAKQFITDTFTAMREAALANPEASFQDLKGDREFLKENHFRTTGLIGPDEVPFEIRHADFDFQEDLFAYDEGAILESFRGSSDTRFGLVRILEKQEPDMAKLEEARTDIVAQIRAQNANDLLSAYLYDKLNDYDPNGNARAKLTKAITR
jgi:peptidyl-prolyl cis-trans isomerase D